MKRNLKKFISFFITFIFLLNLLPLGFSDVFAESIDTKGSEIFEATAKDNITAYKDWTINFSNPVEVEKITDQDVSVKDATGNPVQVKLTQGETDKVLVVNYPEGGYKPGETYYLNISKSMMSKIGGSIKKETKMKFTISTDESINVKPAKFAPNVVFFDAIQSQTAVDSIKDILETSDGTQQIILKPNLSDKLKINNINNININININTNSVKKSSLYDIKVDQIFLFESNKDNPNGFSGKVISVTEEGDGSRSITFVQPQIDEIFSDIEFKTKKELKAEDLISKNLPEDATLTFNNEVVGPRDATGGTTKFSELTLDLPRFVITDEDGDKSTTEDQIALSGKFDIRNAILTANLNVKKFSWKPMGVTVIPEVPVGIKDASVQLTADSHQEATLDLYFNKKFSLKEMEGQDNGYDLINTYKKNKDGEDNTNKTGFKANLSGADLGDRYVIGSATFGLGAIQTGFSEVVQGMPSKSIIIGATLFFTTTITGQIKVNASFNFTNDTHIDTGMRYDSNGITKIGSGNTNQPSFQFILNGEVTFTTGIGVGAGLVLVGIIVASVTVDVLQEINLNGFVYYQKKFNQTGVFAGKLNGNLTYKLVGEAQWGLYLDVLGTLKLWIFPKIQINAQLGIKPKTKELFNLTLYQYPFTLASKGVPKDVFAVDYFNNTDLSGSAILSRIDGGINHVWNGKSAGTNINSEKFSARWQGDFDFQATKYNFVVSSDDGIKVYVDNALIINDWNTHNKETYHEYGLTMTAGKHNVKVEYFHDGGNSVVRCNWAREDASFKATYYNNVNLTGEPAVIRMENNIYYDWNGAPPAIGVAGTNFGARWSGNFNFEDKNYTFNVLPIDGARLYVDDTMIIDAWSSKSGVLCSATTHLSKGVHTIRVDYWKGGWSLAGSSIKFDWGTIPDNKFMTYYYNNQTLSGTPVYMKFADNINYSWGGGKPAPNVNTDNFSAVWQGNFDFEAGDYYFYGNGDDGCRAYVDGELIINQWDGPNSTFKSALKTITKGKHLIRFESHDGTGNAGAKFKWDKKDNNFIVNYFNSTNLSGDSVYIDTESGINHLWNGGSPYNGYVNATNFSARWDGTFDFDGGNYTFTGYSDDGIRVYVDDNPIFDYWSGCCFYFTKEVTLTPGKHTIKVEYCQGTGPSSIKLDWGPTPTDTFIAKYYNNTAMAGNPVFIGTENSIDYDWGTGSPLDGVNKDKFSVKWEGNFKFEEAGNYTFIAGADDGIRVYVDDKLFIDRWQVQSSAFYTAEVPISVGTHKIRVEYYENTGSSNIRVLWTKLPLDNIFIGYFYNNKGLSGTPAYVSINDKIDFDWGKSSPVPNVDKDGFSVRWEGSFDFDAARYEFKATDDDGIRVYVDGEKVIEDWSVHGPQTQTALRNLSAGKHNIIVEYYENKSGAVAKFSWGKK